MERLDFLRLAAATRDARRQWQCPRHLADVSEAALLDVDEALPSEAKEIAATLFDYLCDIVDISADASFSDKLAYNKEMGATLKSPEAFRASVYSAIRSTKMVGAFWTDKTPMPIMIGYLTVIPSNRSLTEIMVPRGLS
ncbi:hypothetical protein [Bradyrhizobium sp. DOA9]|uniref:hypothetical protein n=1 Tax=Bradyrhizobium sp. DOA9 TaxID=1126627 RepID=UPI00046A6A36|nr:hypothetical protein [Bradyrhizobium sp. DOA9]GAJ37512.1 hypothetical protein BDOA9_0201290 [Bradyrhizobium sp. DOA9]